MLRGAWRGWEKAGLEAGGECVVDQFVNLRPISIFWFSRFSSFGLARTMFSGNVEDRGTEDGIK